MRCLALAAALLLAALLASTASAALDGTQAEYRSKVEPICAANGRAAKRITGGDGRVGAKGGKGEGLRDSGRRFVKASNALAGTVSKLRAVPRPESDSRLLADWLGQVSDQATLLRKAGRAALDGRVVRAQKLINQTANGSRLANTKVVAYEFRHCVLAAAGFTP